LIIHGHFSEFPATLCWVERSEGRFRQDGEDRQDRGNGRDDSPVLIVLAAVSRVLQRGLVGKAWGDGIFRREN
jgi:hypothetical protein